MIKQSKIGNTEGTNTPAYFDSIGNEKIGVRNNRLELAGVSMPKYNKSEEEVCQRIWGL